MSAYQIVCVTTKHAHRHIRSVGVGDDPAHPDQIVKIRNGRDMIDEGHIFYTIGDARDDISFLYKGRCAVDACRRRTVKLIRTGGDDVTAESLDRLTVCPE